MSYKALQMQITFSKMRMNKGLDLKISQAPWTGFGLKSLHSGLSAQSWIGHNPTSISKAEVIDFDYEKLLM